MIVNIMMPIRDKINLNCFKTVCLQLINYLLGIFLLVSSISFVFYSTISMINLSRATPDSSILFQNYILTPSLAMLVLGVILLGLTYMGSVSLLYQKSCMLEWNAFFMAILAALKMGFGVFSLLHFNLRRLALFNKLHKDLIANPISLDYIQHYLKCCGVDVDDKNGEIISLSCVNSYKNGCLITIFKYICDTNIFIGWSLITVGTAELATTLFSLALSCTIWRPRHEMIFWQ